MTPPHRAPDTGPDLGPDPAPGPAPGPGPVRLRVSHLNPRGDNGFDLRPDAAARAGLARTLGLLDLPELRLQGDVRASAGEGWTLQAQLTAQVVQPCVVSLAPVASRIDEPVRRVFSPHVATPEGDEIEMPDDEVEPLGQSIDLSAIAAEALALALPLYPRAPDAESAPAAAEDGPDLQRPFAGLADLLRGKGD